MKLGDTQWSIVGAFESGGDQREAELFADAETMLTADKREKRTRAIMPAR